jgi:rhodanese-related sulfurtransferase
MKRIFFIIFVMVFVFAGCSNVKSDLNLEKGENIEKSEYKKISAEEAKKIIEVEDVVILDVRTGEEYKEGHIKDSVLLPVTEIPDKVKNIIPDKETKILVYCRSGNRSATAAKTLLDMGYKNVIDFGGINSWPYDIVK